ncbi:MAG: hypothetical protein ACLFNM_03185 [Candidatus Woesearchaeota archaeon]
MKPKEFRRQILCTINPSKYHKISEKPLSHASKLFFHSLMFALVVAALFSIPVLVIQANTFSSTIQVNETVLDSAVDFSSSSSMTSSSSSFYSSGYDLLKQLFSSQTVVAITFVLLIPSLVVLLGLVSIVASFLVILFLAFLSWLVCKNKYNYRDLLVVSTHSLLVPLIFFVAIAPLQFFWWQCIVIAIFLNALIIIFLKLKRKPQWVTT